MNASVLPATNLAIMAMYVFKPVIFKTLGVVEPGKNGDSVDGCYSEAY